MFLVLWIVGKTGDITSLTASFNSFDMEREGLGSKEEVDFKNYICT